MHPDKAPKVTLNEDSSDSVHPMIIDEREDARSVTEESVAKSKRATSNPTGSNLTTINSLVEKEICKTLSETEKRLSNQTAHSDLNAPPERPDYVSHPQAPPPPPPPPPLVIPVKSHSPAPSHFPYPSHSQPAPNKGSIMRGTPISSSTGASKSINMDTALAHPHQYHSPRNEASPLKSPKILDRNLEQAHLLQQQRQRQHAVYMRHYAEQQQQQQQQQSSVGQYLSQQHKASSNKMDSSNPNTYETLRNDFVTSKYLIHAATHSPNHER